MLTKPFLLLACAAPGQGQSEAYFYLHQLFPGLLLPIGYSSDAIGRDSFTGKWVIPGPSWIKASDACSLWLSFKLTSHLQRFINFIWTEDIAILNGWKGLRFWAPLPPSLERKESAPLASRFTTCCCGSHVKSMKLQNPASCLSSRSGKYWEGNISTVHLDSCNTTVKVIVQTRKLTPKNSLVPVREA